MGQTITVPAPPRRPRNGGIKSLVPDFVETPRLAASDEISWESLPCNFPSITRAGCYQTTGPTTDKTYNGVPFQSVIGEPFALYDGVSCWLGSDDEGPSYEDQARTLLEQGEDRVIEKFLWDWAVAGPAMGTTVASLADAIAEAEQYADANYLGQPVILISRFAGSSVPALSRDDVLITKNHTPVLATGAVPFADRKTKVAIIGQPEVYASPVLTGRAPLLGKNKDFALAERVYAVGVDCQFRYLINVA